MFKKGDIIEYNGNVVQLLSQPKWDYYITPWGYISKVKSWHCRAKHLKGTYAGAYVGVFHVEECTLSLPFNMGKKIQKHIL